MKILHQHSIWVLILAALTAGTTFLGVTLQPQTGMAGQVEMQNQAGIEEIEAESGDQSISILFTGDIMLGRYIRTLRDRKGGEFPFSHMADLIAATQQKLGVTQSDLVVGNLEGPITDSNYVNPGTAMIFNFKPEVAELLQSAGFTTLNMANNHTLDMGAGGPKQTHDYLDAVGIQAFGQPDTPDGEFSFISYDFDGLKIGFLGLNDAVIRLDKQAALEKIRALNPEVDFLIIGIHWGFEYETTARTTTTDFAHQMVDAGADFIWGHHPHVIQNSEIYNGAPIYYSLGNFVFDQYWSKATQEGQVVGLTLTQSKDGLTLNTAELTVDLVDGGEPQVRQ